MGNLVGEPFDVALWWVTVLKEGGAEKFEYNSVKVFFLVVTNDAQRVVSRLITVFEYQDMDDSDVVDGFVFAIGNDV